MSVLFQKAAGPTRINAVQINQSNMGYCVPVVMGRGKVQQTIIWNDGFRSDTVNVSGGKGFGGKGGDQYIYSADVLAALCDGGDSGLLGIGDAWAGQSWLQNTDTVESYTITGSTPSYTPNNATSMTGDYGVGYSVPASGSFSDLGAPSPTSISGDIIVAFARVPYVSGASLASGTYSVDTGGTYYFSSADDGFTVSVNYTFALGTVTRQQLAIVPSGLNVPVTGDLPYVQDGGVVYYNPGGSNDGVPLTRVSGTPTATGTYSVDSGSYTVSGSPGSYTVTVGRAASYTFASGDINEEVQLTFKLNDTTALPAGTSTSLSFELIPGTASDAPAALLLSNYPSAALGYPGIAKLLYSPMDLGYGAQIQQNTFEAITADMWGGGNFDCNPVQCILQVLSNPRWGLGLGTVPFPLSGIDNGPTGTWGSGNAGHSGNGAQAMSNRSGIIPSHTSITNENTATAWFAANGFFISPVIDRQDTAASLIGRWLEAGMCAAFMSEGLMKLVPYGDTSAAGAGMLWFAPNLFDAELDDTCFVLKENQDPVSISSSPWTEAYSKVQIQWNNRQNQYAPEITPEEDKAATNRYGSRIEDPQAWDFITTLAAARFAGSMRVRRNVYTRNSYTFKLPFRFGHLEPMSIVSITTSHAWQAAENNTIQLVQQPARITKIIDNPDGTYDVTCEDFTFGAQQPSAFNKATSTAVLAPSLYADPGNTTAIVFEAPQRATRFQGDQIWIGANGDSARWGGCNVLASMDGTKYTQIGTIDNPARMGTLAAALPSGADPDTAHTLEVNLLPNCAPLDSGTTGDADQGNTLCYVDGEFIAYSACTLTGENQFSATAYLRRGQMDTPIGAHASGSEFLRLDGAVFKFTYDPSWYGKTIYLKFQSFNSHGNSLQDASALTAVTFVVPGANPGIVAAGTGNVKLKNIQQAQGVTANPSLASAWADLPEMGPTDSGMAVATKGNPVLISAALSFVSDSTGGAVTDIGWTPPPSTSGSAPPGVTISIAGDGAGASASLSFTGSGGPPLITFTPNLSLSGGANYTAATSTVVITGSDPSYPAGTNTYSCAVSSPSPVANVPVYIQVLMDGVPIVGPVSVITDANGRVNWSASLLLFPSAGSHTFEVQAYTPSSSPVASVSRTFSLVELG